MVIIKVDFFTKHTYANVSYGISEPRGLLFVYKLGTKDIIACYPKYKWIKFT